MSQAYRIGFKDISRDSQLSRLFIQKYMFASSGEDEDLDENLDGVRIDSISYYFILVLIPSSYSGLRD